MSWLPRLSCYRSLLAYFDGEAEAVAVTLEWGNLILEWQIGWRTRRVEPRDAD